MNLYHTTTIAAAREIDLGGFEEVAGDHGIYFADRPLGRDDLGPLGAVIFIISLTDAELVGLDHRDVDEGGAPYHEWLIPSELANHVVKNRLRIDGRISAFKPDQPTVDGVGR